MPTFPRRTRALLFVLTLTAITGGLLAYARSRPPSLSERMRGDSEDATGALAEALAKTPEGEKTAKLTRWSGDAAPGLRFAAIDAFETKKDKSGVETVERAFADSASTVRIRAMEVLPELDKTRGVTLLLRALRDEDSWIRQEAVNQLKTRLKSPAPTPVIAGLVGALDDSDPATASLAAGALRKLTGQPFHAKPGASDAERRVVAAQWKRWWTAQAVSVTPLAPVIPSRTDPAPDFLLTDIDGHAVTLASQRGKLTLLNFWGTWCPPCQAEIPDLVKLDAKYRGRGLDIVGVALAESGPDSVRSWCKKHGVAYRQALSVDSVLHAYGDIHEVPVSVLIDRQGNIRRRWEGERDFATFRAAVESLLSP